MYAKRSVRVAVFIAAICLITAALGSPAVPQTQSEIPVPPYAIPAVSDFSVTQDTVSLVLSGGYTSAFVSFYVDTPSGTEWVSVPLSSSGERLEGSLASFPSEATGYTISEIVVYMETADYFMDFSFDGKGSFVSGRINNKLDTERFYLAENGRIEAYIFENVFARYGLDGNLEQYEIRNGKDREYYNAQHQLLMSDIHDRDSGQHIMTYYDNSMVTAKFVWDKKDTISGYDGNGALRVYITRDEDSTILKGYDTNGTLHSTQVQSESMTTTYDPAGVIASRYGQEGNLLFFEEYQGGMLMRRTERGMLPDQREYTDIFENGVLTKRSYHLDNETEHYDAQGNYLGKTVGSSGDSKTYDTKDHLVEYTETDKDVVITYDSRNNVLRLEYVRPLFYERFVYDGKAGVWYVNGAVYSGPAPFAMDQLHIKEKVVWYPDNTVCSFGPQFRDIDPSLTDLWYMFTPIDLGRDGVQTFELIASNLYVLGQVSVTVSGDTVVVNYSTVHGKNGHVYIKSEYLNIFPDLASVTTVVPEEIGGGFRFGQEISIQNDLKGDTNVLLFVRNVATYRNYVKWDVLLRRYYKNYPGRVALRDQMLEMMD